jgi:hypothetical protein
VSDLVDVHIVGLPLDVFSRTQERNDELFREFALIAADPASAHSAPSRLVRLIDELRPQFAEFTEGPTLQLDAAVVRGDESIDLTYSVPAEAKDAAIRLRELLDETDEYCRAGNLLTLVPDDEVLAVRTWFFAEFIRQINGEQPRPFPGH